MINKKEYFNLLLEKGEEKVPHAYVLDILCLLYENSRDATVMRIDGNYSKLTLI